MAIEKINIHRTEDGGVSVRITGGEDMLASMLALACVNNQVFRDAVSFTADFVTSPQFEELSNKLKNDELQSNRQSDPYRQPGNEGQ